MPTYKFRYLFSSFIFMFSVFLSFESCKRTNIYAGRQSDKYFNWNDTVSYVGIEPCSTCHQKEYAQFISTGMGQSFNLATRNVSDAVFDTNAIVYDQYNHLFYKPLWKNDSLFIKEFRLNKGDTVHKRIEYVNYIVGSGHHTNSHIININGYLYQAPITFYTQKAIWGMAPGFDSGNNSRFSRKIGLECMTCHNGLPDMVKGSENKYNNLLSGINCERCHGPGSLHVREMKAKREIDTSKYIDLTIVNPRDLPVDKQMSVCQRCHLQGVAILEEGKSFEDFKPGMDLSEVMHVFLPSYKGADPKFIMASHVERLKLSACYIKSGKLSCITCHSPHVNVQTVQVKNFNLKCSQCHEKKIKCSEKVNVRAKQQDNCTLCHMKKSSSIDIPHIAITDHKIGIPNNTSFDSTAKLEFKSLKCFTDSIIYPLTKAAAYLKLFEAYITDSALLDSVTHYLSLAYNRNASYKNNLLIHLLFLQKKYNRIIHIADNETWTNNKHDSWTLYRIGEAFYQTGDFEKAAHYFKRSCEIMPYNLDFNNKLGSSYLKLNDFAKAKKTFEYIINQNNKYISGLSNLGFVMLNLGDIDMAEMLYQKAIKLDPDYEQGLLNLAGLYLLKKDKVNAKEMLLKIIDINPGNTRAIELLRNIKHI